MIVFRSRGSLFHLQMGPGPERVAGSPKIIKGISQTSSSNKKSLFSDFREPLRLKGVPGTPRTAIGGPIVNIKVPLGRPGKLLGTCCTVFLKLAATLGCNKLY